jgi:hypothetical protein
MAHRGNRPYNKQLSGSGQYQGAPYYYYKWVVKEDLSNQLLLKQTNGRMSHGYSWRSMF